MAEVNFLLSLSTIFPFLTGLIRRKTILPAYLPLLILFGLGLLAELSTRYAVLTGKYSWIPGNNIYLLLESILIPLQFYVWGFIRSRKSILYVVIGAFVLTWIAEHLIWGSIHGMHPYFRMFYSLGIVLLSINSINYLVVHEEKNLMQHPIFIICTAFIIFFTYQLVYEGIYYIVTNLAMIDTGKLNTAFSIINFTCNILYGIAFLLVPAGRMKDWFTEKNEALSNGKG